MPEWDATRIEHRVIGGTVAGVYDTALNVDFLDVARDNPMVRVLFAARTAGERAVSSFRADQGAVELPPPASMRLADMETRGDWVRLGARVPEEFAFGVVGRFWAGKTVWETIDASEFATFDRPGFAKIGCNLSFWEYGPARTLVSYEARTRATDASARASFLRYWRVVNPFVGVVMRSTLRLIAGAPASSGTGATGSR